MKVLLLGFVRIAHMPYMHDYVSLLRDTCELHLISWNRNGKPDAPAPEGVGKSFVFTDYVEDAYPLRTKLPHFAGFRSFALKIIDAERYDRIVVLHSTPGITILDRLRGQYKGRYVLDYRDVSHENLGLYRNLIRSLSRNAGLVLASSPAYRQYLENDNDILLKHNLLPSTCERPADARPGDSPIRIRYWGMIRHERANLAIIDALGDDPRFELHYHGREEEVAEHLKRHAAEHGYGNVFFHGAYFAEERSSFAIETDLVHNVYENDFATIGAMGNKYYDAVQYRLPQVCTKGSVMGDEVEAKGLGIAVDYESDGLADAVAAYFSSFDCKRLEESCEKELTAVRSDNAKADAAIRSFFGVA